MIYRGISDKERIRKYIRYTHFSFYSNKDGSLTLYNSSYYEDDYKTLRPFDKIKVTSDNKIKIIKGPFKIETPNKSRNIIGNHHIKGISMVIPFSPFGLYITINKGITIYKKDNKYILKCTKKDDYTIIIDINDTIQSLLKDFQDSEDVKIKIITTGNDYDMQFYFINDSRILSATHIVVKNIQNRILESKDYSK